MFGWKDTNPDKPEITHYKHRLILKLGQVKVRVQRARPWFTPEGWNGWLTLPAVFRCQVSGVRCQQLKSTRWVEVAHEVDFPSSVLAFCCNPISVQDSGFDFYWHLKPDTRNRLDLWQSRSSLTWPWGPGFRFRIKFLDRDFLKRYMRMHWL